MIWDHLTPENNKQAKKSLLIVSALTIFVAGVDFTSDVITLFGFGVRIPQVKLVSAGQVLSGMMLVVFVLRSLPIYLEAVAELFTNAMKSKQRGETLHLQLGWGFNDYPDFENGPEGEFKALEHRHTSEMELLTKKLDFVSITVRSISILLVDYSIPILVGFIAAFSPEYPSKLSTFSDVRMKPEAVQVLEPGIPVSDTEVSE